MEKDLMAASWWDNPGQAVDDTPVIRHAPDDNNYHLPDYDMLTKMRGSKVGRFAIIPAANRDGTSKGFDASVAGPVHVDPDAPDGGVVFDPSTVSKRDINQAVSQSYYPHQVFYQLGTPAPLLGFGRGRNAFYGANAQPGFDDPRINPKLPPNAYIAPKAGEDGRQMDAPAVVANGYGGGGYSSYNPMYQAQEEQRVNPAPPLSSLGQPPQSVPAPAPMPQPAQQMQAMPQQSMPQQALPQQAMPQQPQYQAPPPGYYPPQQPYYPPAPPAQPALDPNIQAMMQGMLSMQQQIGQLIQQRQAPLPPTTGMSTNPLPSRPPGGPPSGLATVPVELRRTQRTHVGQPPYPGDEEFDDETARPIRKQVVRNKKTQDVEDEADDMPPPPPTPPRRARRNPNSLVEQDQYERQQTVEEYEEAQEQDRPRKGVITGFETLNVPWLTGPVANKAKKQVFFEIPGAGKHSARYHDVIESEHCVVLVYDTRYEDGTQYLPPDLGEEVIKLHCPTMKKTFSVSSMGFSYPFGVFDQIVLVKHDVEELDYEQ